MRILDDVRGLIEPESSLPPKDRASLLRRLATNYRQCGRPGDAKRLTERLLEVKGLPDRLRTEQDIADAIAAVNSLRDIGRPGDADRMFEQAKQAALRMEREAHPDAERALWAVGSDLYGQRDRSAEAIPFLERAREVWLRKHGPDRPLPYMYLNLVYAYMEVGRPADAIPILEKLCRRTPEGARYGTLNEQFVLSVCYRRAGRPGDAVPVLERVRDTYVAAQGMDGKDALAMALHLGDTYSKLGWFAESVKQLEEALPKFRTTYGMDNSLTRGSMRNLAEGYDQLGKPAKAEPLRRELVDYARTKFGPDHGETLDALARRGLCLVRAGRVEDGLRDAEELAATATGPGLYNAACVYSRAAERIDRATARERDAARALDLLRQAAAKGQNDPMELVGDDDLDAIRDRSEFAALLKEIGAKQPTVYGNALAKLGTTLLQKQKWTRAEPLLRECLAIRETTLPDDWRTFNARALLGGSLLGQTKSAAAKPLLLAGYAGMKQRADTIPNFAKACLPAAAVRLVQLYEATGQPAEAAKWLDEAWAWAETPGEM
ncbi:MAG: tetratricopeptide repeat protein [Gemmataceae bacterium]